MKHDYFIEDLGQATSWFKFHRHRYTCLRCGWAFIVEDGRGRLTALNEFGAPMSGLLNGGRVQTFVDGPCIPSGDAMPSGLAHPATRKAVRRNLRPVKREPTNTAPPAISAK
jgi:hypothetical protein